MKKAIVAGLIAVSIIISCSQEEETVITMADFEATIVENPSPNKVLGKINASTNHGALTFSIIEQSPNNALQINSSTGELMILNESLFDFETYEKITGTVLAVNGNVNESANIVVTLTDDLNDNIIELTDVLDANIEGVDPEPWWNTSPEINSVNFQDSPLIIINSYESTFDGFVACFASRGLLDFDLKSIPANINITSVELVLYKESVTYCPPCGPIENQNTQLYFELIDADWDVSTVNWGNQPSTDNNQTISLHILDIEEMNNFDITDLFLELYNNQNIYQGLMLKITESCIQESVSFFSSNYSDAGKRPRLIIKYN
ncbi:DNRLRE domain-containing protein [Flagellimonas crocea]|uniref:DNRLRE domain-containing protein n=1 Tax=Flagellimonas crocea TaxID=3067311 RepID=UPI00296E8D3F|nr:DNRLRE domain-containing protein [Muricauda sp. DH64]